MTSLTKATKNFRLSVLLTAIMMILTVCLFAATEANAQGVFPDPIVLTPDKVTGELTVKLNSATDDVRITRICLYRIDQFSPDVDAEVACVDVSLGSTPKPEEVAPSGEGMVYSIPFTTAFIVGQDQLFTARNIASFGAGQEISSVNSVNTALIPSLVAPPMWLYVGP